MKLRPEVEAAVREAQEEVADEFIECAVSCAALLALVKLGVRLALTDHCDDPHCVTPEAIARILQARPGAEGE